MSVCTTCHKPGITIYAQHDCPGYQPLAPGDIIHGDANGAFGQGHDVCVRIETVGPDWIVARIPGNRWDGPFFAAGRRALEACIQARNGGCVECPLREDEQPLTVYGLRSYPPIGHTGGQP